MSDILLRRSSCLSMCLLCSCIYYVDFDGLLGWRVTVLRGASPISCGRYMCVYRIVLYVSERERGGEIEKVIRKERNEREKGKVHQKRK